MVGRVRNTTKLADLDLVAVDQHRGVDRFMIDVRVVEAVEVDEQECPFSSRSSTWRRLTVASSRSRCPDAGPKM